MKYIYKSYVFLAIFITPLQSVIAQPQELYRNSIVNAALHKEHIAPYPLMNINGKRVKMLSYTTFNGYKTTDKKLDATVWMTVEPELHHLCAQYLNKHANITHKKFTLWIAQILGLSSFDANKRRFVIFEIPIIQAYYGAVPKNIGIFRPCTDPRINHHIDNSIACPKEMSTKNADITSEYNSTL